MTKNSFVTEVTIRRMAANDNIENKFSANK